MTGTGTHRTLVSIMGKTGTMTSLGHGLGHNRFGSQTQDRTRIILIPYLGLDRNQNIYVLFVFSGYPVNFGVAATVAG